MSRGRARLHPGAARYLDYKQPEAADHVNVLLVSPRTPDTFWSFSHLVRLVGRKAAFPPLGLLTVAAMLPRSWNLRLVDLNVRALSDADLRWCDTVFLSAMIVHETSAREIIARSNRLARPVVAGGPLFTTAAERFPEVATCVVGEAEDIMPGLIADLEAGRLKPRYEAQSRPDVTRTPLPRWDLIRARDYITLSVQASRGCPFDCEFCDITAVYGRVPRVKSPAQFVAELEAVCATGWRDGIFVVDDNFIGNRARTKELLRAVIDWQRATGRDIRFTTEATINLIDDPELLDLMVRAGFRKVFIGIESPDEASLKECRKTQNTRRDLVEAVRRIHSAGIEVMGGFIVGFDNDGQSVFERQRRFIQEAGVVTAMVGMLTALPGTKLFTRLTREGRLLGPSTGNNLDGVLNFVPTLDASVLTQGYRWLLQELYAPHAYYERILTFLRSYRPSRPRVPTLSDVLAFVRSVWVMGVLRPGRWRFWAFLCRCSLFHRRAFAEAIDLAIRGHHFRTIAANL